MSKRDETSSNVQIVCPKCRRTVSVSAAEAEKKMTVRCACGASVPLVKAF